MSGDYCEQCGAPAYGARFCSGCAAQIGIDAAIGGVPQSRDPGAGPVLWTVRLAVRAAKARSDRQTLASFRLAWISMVLVPVAVALGSLGVLVLALACAVLCVGIGHFARRRAAQAEDGELEFLAGRSQAIGWIVIGVAILLGLI